VVRNWLDTCPGTEDITCHGTFSVDLGPDANLVYSLSSKIGVGPNLVTLSAPVNGSGFDWHHYAMTADGVTLTLYWDGQQVGTASYLGNINTPTFQWLAVGAQLDGSGTQIPSSPTWPGAMDDLAIWSRALDSKEIGAIYNFGLQGTPVDQIPPLLGPPLTIVRSGANVTISWSADLTSFKLQSSPSLKNPNAVWTDVPGSCQWYRLLSARAEALNARQIVSEEPRRSRGFFPGFFAFSLWLPLTCSLRVR
jgi:hypothetical protein